jgi:hypothetical protein
MANYLLSAPDADMVLWRARAAAEGVSLAQWLRDAAAAHRQRGSLLRAQPQAAGATANGEEPAPARPTFRASFRPAAADSAAERVAVPDRVPYASRSDFLRERALRRDRHTREDGTRAGTD